ncbi:hypothetical protein INT45_004965 [Circinella minor]|uniref:Uncharacterized protein n=1 Tax=Circinella minor TaxID=1195481 RepID=A0A8H7S5Q9_9FUNG|nr:hypothetical protein INT45_004965 [Circinella minor]
MVTRRHSISKRASFKIKVYWCICFIRTVLREGLEAVVFIGGVSLNVQAKSIPTAAIMGFLCGCLVGFIVYRGGSILHLRWFFIVFTMILCLITAGLVSKAVGYFEQYAWNQVIGGEAAEEGGDVIAYKVTIAVWHVSWSNSELNVDSKTSMLFSVGTIQQPWQFIDQDGQIIGKEVIDEERIAIVEGEKVRVASIKA